MNVFYRHSNNLNTCERLSIRLVVKAKLVIRYLSAQVECRKKLEEDAEDSDDVLQVQTFGDVGAKAFGVAGCLLSELLILVSYVGGAVAYFVIMGENLSSVMGFFITNSSIHPSAFTFLLLLPLEIALSFVRSLSFLAPFSAFATLCNVFAMVVVIKEDVDKIAGSSFETSGSAFKGFGCIPFVLGFSVFCFNGLGMTLPLEGSMSKRRMFPLVLLQVFVGLLLLYICFGAFGHMAYGEETKDIITLNLPNNWSAVSVKVINVQTVENFSCSLVMHISWFLDCCH